MPTYFDLEVSLLEIEPPISRRFLIRDNTTFLGLHNAIQDAFGWQRKHLYEFRHCQETMPGIKTPVRRIARCKQAEILDDEHVPFADGLKLASFFAEEEDRCLYLYDFGDGWQHLVHLEGVEEFSELFKQRLLDGAMACPPEDCGGTMGYEECREAAGMSEEEIKKLDVGAREEIEWRQEWLDGWQPEEFDLKAIRKRFDL